jgi:hypothetical protein
MTDLLIYGSAKSGLVFASIACRGRQGTLFFESRNGGNGVRQLHVLNGRLKKPY